MDITAEDMWADTEPEGCYDGPWAYTARQLADGKQGTQPETARNEAQRMVHEGKWVQVKVRSDVRGHRVLTAWVKTEIYEEWERQRGSVNGEER